MNKVIKILLLTAVMMAGSCSIEDPVEQFIYDSPIEFTSSRMRIITKAGDQAQKFDEGTKFRLFAVQNGTEWSQDGTKFYNLEGNGEATGKIEYSIDGKKASYDVGKNLDFYGVTYGSTGVDIEIEGASGEAPIVKLELDDNQFQDLMYSSNLKNKNSASGLLHMEFRHTMAKLKFEVLKQNEDEDTDKQLENVVLTKVVLKGSAHKASFNAKEGVWTTTAINDRSVFNSAAGMKIEASAQRLQDNGKDIEILVVPNTTELFLDVTVDVDGNTATTSDQKTVEYKLMANESDFLRLEQNHEYTLSIVVLKNDVRIVTVTPKVYDWVDIDMGDVAYFGQPVYFGGLMWMDRNIGAQSADCENDWYNSLGYYYQFGRNIPYMIDIENTKIKEAFGFSGVKAGDTDPDAVMGLSNVYTYDNLGNKVTTVKHANHSSGSCLYGNIAINPGDEGDYSFIRGFIYKTSNGVNTLNSQSWAKKNLDFINSDDRVVEDGFDNHIFWQTIENQPCPKGWRLPRKSDMYSFMPESTTLYWLDNYNTGDDLTAEDTGNMVYGNYKTGNKNAAGETYEWKYFAGMFKIDPSAEKSSKFSTPVKDSYGRVYGIKYEGEKKAYRVMFEQRASTYGAKRKYVRISRYETQSTDKFLVSDDGTQWNIHQFDWSIPAETMDIPLAGFLYEDGMSDFGSGTILRAAEGDDTKSGHNWTMYLRSGHRGIAVAAGSRRMLGENIRCVRDVNAK